MTEGRSLDDHSPAKTTNVVDLNDAFDAFHIDKGKKRERPPALLLATHDSHENSPSGKGKERARDAHREKVIISLFY